MTEGGDTLFTFNYRSDRVREIVTVLGLPDKPMEVTVPDNLVRSFVMYGNSSAHVSLFVSTSPP